MGHFKDIYKRIRYSRRFYMYFLSYILLLSFILLILGAAVYNNFIATLQEDVEHSNIAALMQLKTGIDMRIKEMEKIAVNISLDSDLRPYMVTGTGTDSLQAVRQLNKYKSGNEFLYDIALYHKYKGNQKIYTTNAMDSLDMYFKYIYNYINWGKEDFLRAVESMHSPVMRPPEAVRADMSNGSKQLATFIYPLQQKSDNPHSFVLFQIEERVLTEMIKDVLKSYDGYVYILDEKNKPLAYYTEGENELDESGMLSSLNAESLSQVISNLSINNKNYSVVKLSSDYNRWSYITVMCTGQFMEKVYTSRSIFNYVLLVVSIMGMLIAFVLAAEIGNGYGVDLVDEGGAALLLNLKAELGKERHISELAFKAKDYIKQCFGYTLTVGIGNTYNDIAMIHESFIEASRAAYYRLVKGNDNVIFYEDLKEGHGSEYKYPADKEKKLIIALRQGNDSLVEKYIRDIKEFAMNSTMSPESVRLIYFGIINSIIRTLDEMEIMMADSINNDKKKLLADSFETIDILSNRIFEFSQNVCSLIRKQKESKNFELREKLLNIISKRYNENTLSLDILADECGLSSSYVSRFFKDQTGFPPTSYVDMLRMNEAKRLLKGTTLPLKDILQQVGYIDESNFIRKFKKVEGVTPMKYRGIIQSEVNGCKIPEN